MKVSVIIPFYHGNKYINQICRMMEDNYEYMDKKSCGELEVIFVNDSPEERINVNPNDYKFRIIIVENPINCGIHKSRVNGLEKSNGDYILFLDQDDLISQDCIARHIQNIGLYDFSVSNGYIMGQNGERKDIYKNRKHILCCFNLEFHYGYTNPIVSPGQVLIKKNAVPNEWKVKILNSNGADDHFLWLLLLEQGKKGTVIMDKLYTHVSTGNNASLNASGMCASSLEMISALEDSVGGISKKYLHMFRRRTLYYGSHPDKLVTKIRFADVGVDRMKYSKLMR